MASVLCSVLPLFTQTRHTNANAFVFHSPSALHSAPMASTLDTLTKKKKEIERKKAAHFNQNWDCVLLGIGPKWIFLLPGNFIFKLFIPIYLAVRTRERAGESKAHFFRALLSVEARRCGLRGHHNLHIISKTHSVLCTASLHWIDSLTKCEIFTYETSLESQLLFICIWRAYASKGMDEAWSIPFESEHIHSHLCVDVPPYYAPKLNKIYTRKPISCRFCFLFVRFRFFFIQLKFFCMPKQNGPKENKMFKITNTTIASQAFARTVAE